MTVGRLIPNMNLASQIAPSRDTGFAGGSLKIGGGAEAVKGNSFGQMVSEGIDKVNAAVNDFDAVSKTFASGGKVNLHEMMIKGENASMSLKLMVTLRNKVIDAYQEVMRMQV